jgi:hypothetical protein
MDRKLLSVLAASATVVLWVGCSSTAPPAKKDVAAQKAAAPPEPASAQSAIFAIYQVARTWAADVEILRLENINLEDVKSQPGKYGAWRATMASKAGRKKRDYTYSVIEADATLHKGVFAQSEQDWIMNLQNGPFTIQAVKVDSPAAVEEARKNKEVQAILKKKPDSPVQILLEWTGQTQVPAYRVIFGPTISMSDISAYIDSQTGTFLKKAH